MFKYASSVVFFPPFMVSHVNSYSIYAVLVLCKLTYNYLEVFWFIFQKNEVRLRFHVLGFMLDLFISILPECQLYPTCVTH